MEPWREKNGMGKRRSKDAVEDITQPTTGQAFDRLSGEEKETVWNYFNRKIPKSELYDPTPAQKAALARHRKKMRA